MAPQARSGDPSPPILERVPLAPRTSLGVGGAARYFLRASHPDALRWGAAWARRHGVPLLLLGGGSNLVIADEGFPGLVVEVAWRGREIAVEGDVVRLSVAAGEPWDELVADCVESGWAGVECLSGIPGRVGATPIQNVGAYGQEIADCLDRVVAWDLQRDRQMTFDRASCRFGYRDSLFKGEERGRYAILEVHLRLRRGGAPAIRYPELARALADGATAGPDLQQVRRTVLDLRRRKGMVLDPADPDSRSDGSFFVNPVLTIEEHRLFLGRVTECLGEAVVPASFPADDGRIKVSAAWLVEHAGYSRGHRQGGAGISSKHALALVNLGHGSATEIVALARQIQADVLRRFAIRLRVEPVLVGFSSSPNEVAEED